MYCPLQLLELEREVVQGLVLRQPSLLARASEGLQGKVTAYADIFGEDVGQVNRQEVGRQAGSGAPPIAVPCLARRWVACAAICPWGSTAAM